MVPLALAVVRRSGRLSNRPVGMLQCGVAAGCASRLARLGRSRPSVRFLVNFYAKNSEAHTAAPPALYGPGPRGAKPPRKRIRAWGLSETHPKPRKPWNPDGKLGRSGTRTGRTSPGNQTGRTGKTSKSPGSNQNVFGTMISGTGTRFLFS